jgi:hypothetical protein
MKGKKGLELTLVVSPEGAGIVDVGPVTGQLHSIYLVREG